VKVAVIGAGHVGLITGVCLAEIGHRVICVDNNTRKISSLKKKRLPFYEPQLQELLYKNMKKKRLSFSTTIKSGVDFAEVIFIAVGTPPGKEGEADLYYVENVSKEVARNMKSYKIIVEKSTVPVETGERIIQTIKMNNKRHIPFDVVSNPEFLREGSAVIDTLHPDRIVIGVANKRAEKIMRELYRPIRAPILVTDIKSAEIIKHASNSFLSLKISFINAVANICEKVGADVELVARGMGMDKRIGRDFLKAGIGYGGSCFPKDVAAFTYIAEKLGYDFQLLKAVQKVNEDQKKNLVNKLKEALWILNGKTIGILGLAFKPDTDDMRDAPSIDIINLLKEEGAKIKAYDPVSIPNARKILKQVQFCSSPYEVARGSHALAVVTEWNEFRKLNLSRLKRLMEHPIIIDGRNIFEPAKMNKEGFIYKGTGR